MFDILSLWKVIQLSSMIMITISQVYLSCNLTIMVPILLNFFLTKGPTKYYIMMENLYWSHIMGSTSKSTIHKSSSCMVLVHIIYRFDWGVFFLFCIYDSYVHSLVNCPSLENVQSRCNAHRLHRWCWPQYSKHCFHQLGPLLNHQ